jgi:hypothetical protein
MSLLIYSPAKAFPWGKVAYRDFFDVSIRRMRALVTRKKIPHQSASLTASPRESL